MSESKKTYEEVQLDRMIEVAHSLVLRNFEFSTTFKAKLSEVEQQFNEAQATLVNKLALAEEANAALEKMNDDLATENKRLLRWNDELEKKYSDQLKANRALLTANAEYQRQLNPPEELTPE